MNIILNEYHTLLTTMTVSFEEMDISHAYELSEYLFIYTQYPYFYNACLYFKSQTEIRGKDLLYLSYACRDTQLRKLLQGTYSVYEKDREQAIKAFEHSLLQKGSEEVLPLFLITRRGNLLIFDIELTTICESVKNNLQTVGLISALGSYRMLVKFPLDHLPYIDSENNITMSDISDRDISVSIDKKRSIPVSEKSPKTLANDEPKYPIEEPHRIEAEVDEPADQNIWHKDKDDDIWRISYEGKPAIIQDLVGLTYISHLLQDPFKEFPLSELDELVNPGKVDIDSPAVKKLGTEESYDIFSSDGKKLRYEKTTDRKSIESYKKEIKRLEVKIDHAESTENYDEAELLREEKESIEGHIDESTSFVSKKPLLTVPELELIRKRIYNDVRYSIKIINKKHKPLANHLRQFIKIRKYSKYVPSPEISWDIQL